MTLNNIQTTRQQQTDGYRETNINKQVDRQTETHQCATNIDRCNIIIDRRKGSETGNQIKIDWSGN